MIRELKRPLDIRICIYNSFFAVRSYIMIITISRKRIKDDYNARTDLIIFGYIYTFFF